MKTIVIGVMPQEQIRARAIAIVKGQYKPKPGEPKIWFNSMKSVAEVLSDQNRALLKMSRYGLVDLQRETNHVRPVVKASEFRIVAAA
jgi:predicted transcriptional regulator